MCVDPYTTGYFYFSGNTSESSQVSARGLGHVTSLRCTVEVSDFGDGNEIAQLVSIQEPSVLLGSNPHYLIEARGADAQQKIPT
jgi:hypothetical protein